jgi:hypothetical protein
MKKRNWVMGDNGFLIRVKEPSEMPKITADSFVGEPTVADFNALFSEFNFGEAADCQSMAEVLNVVRHLMRRDQRLHRQLEAIKQVLAEVK